MIFVSNHVTVYNKNLHQTGCGGKKFLSAPDIGIFGVKLDGIHNNTALLEVPMVELRRCILDFYKSSRGEQPMDHIFTWDQWRPQQPALFADCDLNLGNFVTL